MEYHRLTKSIKSKKTGITYNVGDCATVTFEKTSSVIHFINGRVRTPAKNLCRYFESFDPLPSDELLADWICDGMCESVTGQPVEPDGYGTDGSPSWLLALGLC
jgi:hypothetical protein